MSELPSSETVVRAAPLKDFNGTKYHVCTLLGFALCNGRETTPHLRVPAQSVEPHTRCNRKACRQNYPDFRRTGDTRIFK
jgi:hypothetical protein